MKRLMLTGILMASLLAITPQAKAQEAMEPQQVVTQMAVTRSSSPYLVSADITVGNTLKGICANTQILTSVVVPKLGAKNKILQEKGFFGYTSKELAPEHYHTSQQYSLGSDTFVYREVGKTYRVKATHYYEYGGQTYSFENQTDGFVFII